MHFTKCLTRGGSRFLRSVVSRGKDVLIYDFAKISHKLHEIEKNLVLRQWRIQDFPDGGGNIGYGPKSIIWQDFCRKLLENEINWTERIR